MYDVGAMLLLPTHCKLTLPVKRNRIVFILFFMEHGLLTLSLKYLYIAVVRKKPLKRVGISLQ